ncbi:MAG: ECF-type sigma factor [Aureliella sp.]
MTQDTNVTQLIEMMASGDGQAACELFSVLYDELRAMAKLHLQGEAPGITLQSTALVHEAWIKLVGASSGGTWANRQHFFATAAQAMRRILVDAARSRNRKKRGGSARKLELVESDAIWQQDEDLLLLDEALEQLEQHDERKALLVKLRYFAGLTNAQAAEQIGVSTATAERDWTYARAWLRAQMSDDP